MSAVAERTAWMDRALCVGADPERWFDGKNRTYAQQVCAACPVIAQCRASGCDEYRGVWGGIAQTRKEVGPSPSGEYLGFPHGTSRGYAQHLREGSPSCERCLVASRFATQESERRNPRVRTAEELERQERRRKQRLLERRQARAS